MANWLNVIKIGPEWEKTRDGEMTIPELAQLLAAKLRDVRGSDAVLRDIRLAFEGLDEEADTDDFDKIIGRLYDWGDYNHRLFIDTFLSERIDA